MLDAGRIALAADSLGACEAMIELTLERGAKDNVTVVAMRCLPPPELEEEDDLMDDVLELDTSAGEAEA